MSFGLYQVLLLLQGNLDQSLGSCFSLVPRLTPAWSPFLCPPAHAPACCSSHVQPRASGPRQPPVCRTCGVQIGCCPGSPQGWQGWWLWLWAPGGPQALGRINRGPVGGYPAGARLGDASRAAGLILKAGQGRVVEATAGSLEQGVGQYGCQHQRSGAQDGGSGRTCLDLEKQQGIDGQCWGRKGLLLSQSTNACSPSAMGDPQAGMVTENPPPHTMNRMHMNSPHSHPHNHTIITSVYR